MTTKALDTVLLRLRGSLLRQNGAGLTDGELLECYVARRDEAAFEALVRRHGAMVFGVCRRILRNEADAEDAFQATFLVLVRKAASVRPRGMVGNWLYGVAHNTARKAKAMNTRRRTKEREAEQQPRPEAAAEDWQHLQQVLDEELSRLPDKYRSAIVHCDLEGETIKEAARRVGCPQGTLSARVARGRALLARRLASRGLAMSGGLIAAVLSPNGASAGVPMSLVVATVKAASLFAAGQAASGIIGAKVAALTEGVLKAMLLTKLKVATALLVFAAFLAAGAGMLTQQVLAEQTPATPVVQSPTADAGDSENQPAAGDKPAPQDPPPEKQPLVVLIPGIVKAVDADKMSITVTVTREGKNAEETFKLSKNVTVFIAAKPKQGPNPAGSGAGPTFLSLKDLKPGTPVALSQTTATKVVSVIRVVAGEEGGQEGKPGNRTVQEVDLAKKTITVSFTREGKRREETFPLADNIEILVADRPAPASSGGPPGGPGSDGLPTYKPGKLSDIKAGMLVTLKVSEDKESVVRIREVVRNTAIDESTHVLGILKAVDPKKNTVTVTVAREGKNDVDETLALVKDARVLMETPPKGPSGRPEEKNGELADLKAGMRLVLKRSALDEKAIDVIRVLLPGRNVPK